MTSSHKNINGKKLTWSWWSQKALWAWFPRWCLKKHVTTDFCLLQTPIHLTYIILSIYICIYIMYVYCVYIYVCVCRCCWGPLVALSFAVLYQLVWMYAKISQVSKWEVNKNSSASSLFVPQFAWRLRDVHGSRRTFVHKMCTWHKTIYSKRIGMGTKGQRCINWNPDQGTCIALLGCVQGILEASVQRWAERFQCSTWFGIAWKSDTIRQKHTKNQKTIQKLEVQQVLFEDVWSRST